MATADTVTVYVNYVDNVTTANDINWYEPTVTVPCDTYTLGTATPAIYVPTATLEARIVALEDEVKKLVAVLADTAVGDTKDEDEEDMYAWMFGAGLPSFEEVPKEKKKKKEKKEGETSQDFFRRVMGEL